MSIALVQDNGSVGASGTNNTGTPPAWSPATTAGNLLLIILNANTATAAVVTNLTGNGWSAVTDSMFLYRNNGSGGMAGIYYKIAAGSDATPGTVSCTGTTNIWDIYTYEFSSTTGWLNSPFDTSAHSATGNTAFNTLASGSTATLAQADELAIAVLANTITGETGISNTGSFTIVLPTTNAVNLQFGWKETAATTAVSNTWNWTGTARSVSWVATFKVAAAIAQVPYQPWYQRAPVLAQ